jgi:hypothetical protein
MEIAKVLDPSLQLLAPVALLETRVVKPDVKFDPDKIIEGKLPKEEDLLLHQRILSAG